MELVCKTIWKQDLFASNLSSHNIFICELGQINLNLRYATSTHTIVYYSDCPDQTLIKVIEPSLSQKLFW